MKKIFTAIFFLTLCILCSAQVPELTNWKTDTIPEGNRVYTANQSQSDWIFKKVNDKWEVVQNDFKQEMGDEFPFSADFINKNQSQVKGNRFVKKTGDGYLVGLNKGEFGGGLYFVSPDGFKNYEIAKYLNIHNIFEYNTRYFAIEGLSHLGISRGQIIEIYKEDNLWKYRSLTTLMGAPELITDYNKEKIIITNQYILKFGQDLKVTEILKSPFYWGMLYPSSILVDKNDLYLAMRQGILKIKKFDTAPEYEWYIPK